MATNAKVIIDGEDRTRAAFTSLARNVGEVTGKVGGLQGQFAALLGVLAAPTLFAVFDQLNKQAGSLQDIAEKTGDTAESFASLNLAAGTVGASMDAIGQFSVKLTKNLTGVDDESKKAGAAIVALGLDLKTFKELRPADQIEALSKALAGFQDGAGKTAVLEALAKGGAELLPFLKELGQEGGRQVILTEEQIKLADEYTDKQAKLRASINLHAQAIAVQMLPAYNALSAAMLDVVKEIGGVEESTNGLKNDKAIQDWATEAVKAVGFVVDAFDGVGRTVAVAGKYIGAYAALIGALVRGESQQAKTIAEELKGDIEGILGRETFSDKLTKRLAQASGVSAPAWGGEGRDRPKKKLTFDGAKDKSEAAQVAKAQLALDIDAIKKASDELVGTYANAEKIMEAVRAAGLLDEREYYDSKRAFINLETQAKESALQAEIARYREERLAGKDKLENDKKIAAAESALAMLRAKNVTDQEVLSIQQKAAVDRVAKSYEEARIAAELYLAVSGKQYQRELAAFGRGDQDRSKVAAFNQIDDKYQNQRDDLENQKRLLEFEGKFTAEARQQHETRLAIINRFHGLALTQWEQYYAELMNQQTRWENGATRALENYLEGTKNVAGQTEKLFTDAFQGMEDALVEFVKTGKLDFKSLADSIITDLVRMQIKAEITGPLAEWTKGQVGGGGGGSGIFGSIVNTLLGRNTGAVGAGTGSAFDNMDFGGFFAEGGTLRPGQWGIAGENGPERIYAGSTPVHVQPNGRGVSISQSFAISGPMDRRTQDQIALAAMTGAQRALSRNG